MVVRIRVDEIPEEGLEVEIGQDDAWARDAVRGAVEGAVAGLEVRLQITLIAELVRVSGTAKAVVTRACDRCGGDIRLPLGGTVELLFEPQRHEALHEERITDPSELNLGFFDGRALEMADVLMEQFALWLPERVRCGDAQVTQVGEAWTCALPDQDPGPKLDTHNPFANLRLPE